MSHHPYLRVTTGILGAMAILFGILEAAHVAQDWYRGRIEQPDLVGWSWLALLPVWLFLFFRYYSIFRKDCNACLSSREEGE